MDANTHPTNTHLILAGDSYQHFINTIRSDVTLSRYTFALKKYMADQKVTDVKELLVAEPKLIEARIIDYIISLKKQDLSSDSINLYLCAISHFYTVNDITLNRVSFYL